MRKKLSLLSLFVTTLVALAAFAGAKPVGAFPAGAMLTNLTLNPGAVPAHGTGIVTISYMCGGSGCFSTGGSGTLTITPAGHWIKASTCAPPNSTTPTPQFDCPLQASAESFGILSNRLTLPGPEPATPGIHIFQAVFLANGASPGMTLNICYSSSTQTPPSDGSGPGLCQSVLVTRDADPVVEVKALTSNTIEPGGRVVLAAQVMDDKKQPIAGLPVTFRAANPNLGIVSCATNADFAAAKIQFKPIVVGTAPAAVAPPGAGLPPTTGIVPSLGSQVAPFLVGDETGAVATGPGAGGPLPGTGDQNTPPGYQCYSGSAATVDPSPIIGPGPIAAAPISNATAPKGMLPQLHEVSVLADAEGIAVATFLSLPSAKPGALAKVVAEVYKGVSDKPVARADAPTIQVGSLARETAIAIRANPTTISPTNPIPNGSELIACAAKPATAERATTPVATAPDTAITFSIVSRNPEDIDVAFAQADGRQAKNQIAVPPDSEGCAKVTLIAGGNGTVTIAATIAGAQGTGNTATISLPVNTAPPQQAASSTAVAAPPAQTAQPGFFADAPSGTHPVCPNTGIWALLYWQGADTPIDIAMNSCPNAGRFWVRRGTTWIAARAGDKLASDQFIIIKGEAVLIYGSR